MGETTIQGGFLPTLSNLLLQPGLSKDKDEKGNQHHQKTALCSYVHQTGLDRSAAKLSQRPGVPQCSCHLCFLLSNSCWPQHASLAPSVIRRKSAASYILLACFLPLHLPFKKTLLLLLHYQPCENRHWAETIQRRFAVNAGQGRGRTRYRKPCPRSHSR